MARWQISLLVTGMMIAVGVFIGVTLYETTETSRDPRSSDARPIEKGDEYVAIGDSYTGAPWGVFVASSRAIAGASSRGGAPSSMPTVRKPAPTGSVG